MRVPVTLLLSTALLAAASDLQSNVATVSFTPYALVGCRQSQNPYDKLAKASNFNVTSGDCITPSYAFSAYVQMANDEMVNGPCQLVLYPEANCQGTRSPATVATYAMCQTGRSDGGASFQLVCDA